MTLFHPFTVKLIRPFVRDVRSSLGHIRPTYARQKLSGTHTPNIRPFVRDVRSCLGHIRPTYAPSCGTSEVVWDTYAQHTPLRAGRQKLSGTHTTNIRPFSASWLGINSRIILISYILWFRSDTTPRITWKLTNWEPCKRRWRIISYHAWSYIGAFLDLSDLDSIFLCKCLPNGLFHENNGSLKLQWGVCQKKWEKIPDEGAYVGRMSKMVEKNPRRRGVCRAYVQNGREKSQTKGRM